MANCPQNARNIKVKYCVPYNGSATPNYLHIQSALDPDPTGNVGVLCCVTIDGQTPDQSHLLKFSEKMDKYRPDIPYPPITSWSLSLAQPSTARIQIIEILPYDCCCAYWGPSSTVQPPGPDNIITMGSIVDSCNNQAYECDNGSCNFVGSRQGTYSGDLYYTSPYTGNNLISSSSCWLSSACASWNCKIDKFGNSGCIQSFDGTGIYTSLQDCQDNCESTLEISVDYLGDIIKPWIDEEGGTCLYDIKSCPCGWDYIQSYQPPEVTPPQQPVYAQFAGANMCLSPDYALWESTLGSAAPNSTFGGLMSPFSLPCAELQGVYNPTVGMTIEGSQTNPLGNFLAGSITNTINNTPTTHTWDKHVIVEVNPAFNSSILNPNLQVIQSTPCQ